jgi:hypothetical protein
MNRLVLIGNGFDLTHGLRTSYKDFFYWYWGNRVRSICDHLGKTSDDGLCQITILQDTTWHGLWCSNSIRLSKATGEELFYILTQQKNDFKIVYSPFFESIQKGIETKGWVDIENEYYSQLIHSRSKEEYCILNKQLEILRDLLKKYLEFELDNRKAVNVIASIKNKMNQSVPKEEMAVASELHRSIFNKPLGINNVMLLSFNYTPIANIYENTFRIRSVNYIHGKLNNPESIIFGYGDELDDDFNRLLKLNENECLRHIKSVRYLESDNYRRMLEFIESDYFQVCIMGHSCGNSDRTLLNTIFEHKNCISIKPYYYKKEDGTDNYIELIQNISRNFKDMKLMRDRVVNKMYCEPLT